MKTQSDDTHPDVERVQIELLQKMTVTQRAQLAFSMSDTAITLAKRAIRRANPNASEEELMLIFVSVHYGEDLTKRLREYLKRRQ